MHPYYIARAVGGLLFLIGAIVGAYNILMTIRSSAQPVAETLRDRPASLPGGAPIFQPGE
jgi:cytochrome c oxidase cbb3-type subunit 1